MGSTSIIDRIEADAERLDAENKILRAALETIRDTPHNMVNDSESLRHTLRAIDWVARQALGS